MRVVLCNASPEEAPRLARALVEEGLAACVNAIPGVRSWYVWEGALHEDAETTLVIKVAEARLGALRARLRELHSYDTPEIVALSVDVEASDPEYVAWVRGAGP